METTPNNADDAFDAFGFDATSEKDSDEATQILRRKYT